MTELSTECIRKLARARSALVMDQPFFGVLALRLVFAPMPEEMVKKREAEGFKATLAVDGRTIFCHEPFIDSLSPALVTSAVSHEVGHCVYDHMARRGSREPGRWNQAADYVVNEMLEQCGMTLDKNWLRNTAFDGMSADEIYNLLPPGDPDDPDGGQDECMDSPTGEREEISEDWKVATIQAAEAAQASGKLPASLKRFIKEALEPVVDWKSLLRQFITQTSKNDYSWARPNRYFASMGYFLPSLYSQNAGVIVTVVDTSGSITDDMLAVFGAEVKAIVSSVMPEKLIVIYCDTDINHIDEFGPTDDIAFKMHGGGGTSFVPPFDYLRKQGITPACLVYFTDLYGPFPAPADFPTLWCATSKKVAPFGQTVYVDV